MDTRRELIERFAAVYGLSYEEAELKVGAPTEEEIMKKVSDYTLENIRSKMPPLNRAQRRALKKKAGSKNAQIIDGSETQIINDVATKLNYIDLIQKLRKLNEQKEKENGEAIIEDD